MAYVADLIIEHALTSVLVVIPMNLVTSRGQGRCKHRVNNAPVAILMDSNKY
jgi:hypothetical protein